MIKQIPDHIFRGYDIRGIAGKELTQKSVGLLVKAYATWLLQRRIYNCVVGYDCRVSSPPFAKAMTKGLLESGISVYDIGMTLTQIAYWAQYHFLTRGMVMITASHNPKEYNGMKFATGFSDTMVTEEIQEFKKIVKSGKFLSKKPDGRYIKKDVFPYYIKDLLSKVEKIKKFKVIVDASASTPGIFIPKLLREAGCEVIEQNTKPNGNFPVGTPDPTERNVQERLARRVLKEKADLGFSYDCDGDRVGIVDEKGTLIWNDTLISLFVDDILDYLPGSKIVYNTLCSKQVTDVITQKGGIAIMWITGHSFIKAKVREERAAFGGELSGHFFFVDNFYGHDDGAIATLRLLSYLTRKNQTLGQCINKLPKYISSPEIKVGCPDNIKFDIVSGSITGSVKRLFPKASFIEIDGIRMDTKDEMVIIRASQNGPYLTVKFEAKQKIKYDLLKGQIRQILEKIKEIDFKSGVNISSLE